MSAPAPFTITDFHNHVIPGVDDGASNAEESRQALAAFVAEGVRRLIATPHLAGSKTLHPEELTRRLDELDEGWARLQPIAAEFPELRVQRAAEVMLDVPEPDLSDPRLRLAGGRFVLVEFPYMRVPLHSPRAVAAIRAQGWVPIVAHPERYQGLDAELRIVDAWRHEGALCQLNGPSLLGRYGKDAQRAAFSLLARGLVDYLSSDFHARGRPLVSDYCALLERLGAEPQLQLLLETNPARMADGEMPLSVEPFRPRFNLWTRIQAMLGRGSPGGRRR